MQKIDRQAKISLITALSIILVNIIFVLFFTLFAPKAEEKQEYVLKENIEISNIIDKN